MHAIETTLGIHDFGVLGEHDRIVAELACKVDGADPFSARRSSLSDGDGDHRPAPGRHRGGARHYVSSVPGTCGREFASGTLVRVLENWDTVGLYADVPSGHATKPSSGALAELLLAELNDP